MSFDHIGGVVQIEKRYHIQEELGVGGMGTVFKGLDTVTNQPVAIKQLKPELTNLELIERFQREGEALRDLDHPNIVKMLDSVEENGKRYLVMEYVGGGDLKTLLESEGKLDHERCVNMAIDLADALTRAHRLKIIHRDLKPANVLLGEDGVLRLTDFGVAHVVEKERMTATDVVMGTLDYLAPEALQGGVIDSRADIWAFGVMLYEMLTGERPFMGSHTAAILTAILRNPTPDLQQLCPDAPITLVNLIYRMLEKDPAQRIPSVRQVGAELEGILDGTPVGARFSGAALMRQVELVEAPETSIPNNLPAQPTEFIGRKREIDAIINLLQNHEAVRLVTLSGVGGTGKTRLSIEVGTQLLDEYPDGVYFVELAPITEPDAVLTAISATLSIQELPGETPLQGIIRHLRSKSMLLIMDNFEQVMSAAAYMGDILAGTEKLKMIVSSREVLRINGEHAYPVPPLGMPEDKRKRTANVYAEYEAIRLFVERAKAAKPGFEISDHNAPIIADICARLDGLPLAITLIAARSRMFTPEQLLQRLSDRLKAVSGGGRDLPERQRTLRGAIDWSYDLLDADERRFFARLGVFKGGWSIEAAEEICGDGLGLDVIDGLESLLDKSLIFPVQGALDKPRFTMLETIREYAVDKLDSSDDAALIHDAHLDYHVRWTDGGWQEIFKREGIGDNGGDVFINLMKRVFEEHENSRAAINYGLSRNRVEPVLLICNTLHAFYDRRIYARESIEWMEAGLESGVEIPPLLRAKTMMHLGWSVKYFPGQQARARQYVEAALAISREIEDEQLEGSILNALASAADDLNEQIRLTEQSLEIVKKGDDELGIAIMQGNLASAYSSKGDLETARKLVQQALEFFNTKPEYEGYKAVYGGNLARIEIWEGNYEAAHQIIEEIDKIFGASDRSSFTANFESLQGLLALHEGKPEQAYDHFSEGLDILRESPGIDTLLGILDRIAYVASVLEQWERAATIFGAVAHFREEFGVSASKADIYQSFHQNHLKPVRDNLDKAIFDARWAVGAKMTLEEAMDYAVELR